MKPVLLAVALAVLPTPSAAQKYESQTGSHILEPAPAGIPDRAGMSDALRARSTILGFAECLVLRNRAKVEKAVALPLESAEAAKALDRLAIPECLANGEMRMSDRIMRGALFAALYRADFAKQQPVLRDAPLSFTPDTMPGESEQTIFLLQFGDCIARADPADSRAAILASAGSEREASAFTGLLPHVSACLVQGQSLKFSKVVLLGVDRRSLI
jgi:hypothetical protein